MSQILDYKCPNCFGSLNFNAATQNMTCEMCLSEISMAAFKEYEAACNVEDGMNDLGSYKGSSWDDAGGAQVCNSCAGQLITDGTTIATECPFCGNTAIIKQAVSNALRPDFVIPFKSTQDKVAGQLKGLYKGKTLLPKCFRNNTHIDNVTGLYVPYWLYDCDTRIMAAYDTTRVKRWTTGNTRFVRTDKFLATRNGDMSFNKIPVHASSKMGESDMQAIEPFNYSEMQPFSSAFLAGHVAEMQDVEFEKQKPIIDNRIRTTIDNEVNRTVSGYDTVRRRNLNVNVSNNKISYALFPVWTLNTKYKGKNYKFTMNGQTGQFSGKLPVDGKKCGTISGIITGAFALIMAIAMLLVGIAVDGMHPLVGLLIGLGAGLIMGLIVSLIILMSMRSKMNLGKRTKGAANYSSGFRLSHRNDIFLGSQTTSTVIRNNNAPAGTANNNRSNNPPVNRPNNNSNRNNNNRRR